jgi:hypothetical protein
LNKIIRQECAGYDNEKINDGAAHLLKAYPHNRSVKHLMERIAASLIIVLLQEIFLWDVGNALFGFTGL